MDFIEICYLINYFFDLWKDYRTTGRRRPGSNRSTNFLSLTSSSPVRFLYWTSVSQNSLKLTTSDSVVLNLGQDVLVPKKLIAQKKSYFGLKLSDHLKPHPISISSKAQIEPNFSPIHVSYFIITWPTFDLIRIILDGRNFHKWQKFHFWLDF